MVLVHYADLAADLRGQIARVAEALGVPVSGERLDRIAEQGGFDAMRSRVDVLAPNRSGVLKDNRAFFRGGRSGDGAAQLQPEEYAAFEQRCRSLAPPEVVDWLLR